ncbi:hypothetical protein FVE85_3613 [Porphyridium purpureum]|uniref:Uncharacterized protein n=1 Tax=Porphyridium purpureum TaxID=35688 RepID=A0A5J4YM01_PORPP|nr:hypothetical protein FVE85_3613 [Porphyridium purpureum]|eukprot:POR0174..scf249_10
MHPGGSWRRQIHSSGLACKKINPHGKFVYQIRQDTPYWPPRIEGFEPVDSSAQDDGPLPRELPEKFYGVRVGRSGFRGIVLRYMEMQELILKVPRAQHRSEKSIQAAINYVLAYVRKASNVFFAFRYGRDGARGIATKHYIFDGILPRIEKPTLEAFQFNNATQALVFCQQAGSVDTHWQTMASSVRFLANNLNLNVPERYHRLWVNAVDADFESGPVPSASLKAAKPSPPPVKYLRVLSPPEERERLRARRRAFLVLKDAMEGGEPLEAPRFTDPSVLTDRLLPRELAPASAVGGTSGYLDRCEVSMRAELLLLGQLSDRTSKSPLQSDVASCAELLQACHRPIDLDQNVATFGLARQQCEKRGFALK